METIFDNKVKELREKFKRYIDMYKKERHKAVNFIVTIPEEDKREFFNLTDKVTFNLLEDSDNFFGYFLFQMSREIRFDISSPTGINFKGTKYVIYFNPIIFLELTREQMESSMKHEILHVVSMHLVRAKVLKSRYSNMAINMAMDIVVNKYLDHLPPYATTLEWINKRYALDLQLSATFEYYVDKLQTVIGSQVKADEGQGMELKPDGKELELQDDERDPHSKDKGSDNKKIELVKKYIDIQDDDKNTRNNDDPIMLKYDPAKTHDIWEESSDIDEKTLKEFTEIVLKASEKGRIPTYLKNMIEAFKSSDGELPWNLYLKRLLGTVEGDRRKTITRRDRRQPDRLDIRGQLRSHKARIAVAIDISGSIGDDEFKQAIVEVLHIVKSHSHEITMIECDDRIRDVYRLRSEKDIKDRTNARGATLFSPVFEYANHSKVNLLIYFTDGKGENRLKVIPKGYKVLWVISGSGDELSLREPYGAVKKLRNVVVKDKLVDLGDVDRGGYSMNYQEPN